MFFKIVFETYLIFVFTALLTIKSPNGNPDHHLNNMLLSWTLVILTLIVVPLVLVYVAFQSSEILESDQFLERFGSLFEVYNYGKSQILYRVWFCLRRAIFVLIAFLIPFSESI